MTEMITEFSVTGSKVVVVGAGRSGTAAAELLVRRGASVTLSEAREVIDDSENLHEAGVKLELGGHQTKTFDRAELIVLSPGVSPQIPVIAQARKSQIPVISEVELAARWLRGRIVAITGTKGKSTTATLIGRMIKSSGKRVIVGGNIGDALSNHVDESSSDVIHVVEVSSFQLELTQTFHPWIAVFLNLSHDHLDRHKNFHEYASAKARIFANQTNDDSMVINADDSQVLEIARRGRARLLRFALTSNINEGIIVSDHAIVHRSVDGDRSLFPLEELRVSGQHFLSDVLAASAVGVIIGVSRDAMRHAVGTFEGLEHAIEPAGEIQGVRFINDSKATNFLAMRASIECVDRDLVLIMGGRFKGGEFSALTPLLVARSAVVVAIGEARPRIREQLGTKVEVKEADTMAEAVRVAFTESKPGGVVLLAPGCASLDMFANYEERGRVFKEEIERLSQNISSR